MIILPARDHVDWPSVMHPELMKHSGFRPLELQKDCLCVLHRGLQGPSTSTQDACCRGSRIHRMSHKRHNKLCKDPGNDRDVSIPSKTRRNPRNGPPCTKGTAKKPSDLPKSASQDTMYLATATGSPYFISRLRKEL